MSDKPVNSLLSKRPLADKFQRLLTPRYMVPIGIILFIGFLSGLILLQPHLWSSRRSNTQDIANLKSQTAVLTNRVEQLETTLRASVANPIDPQRLKDIETSISSVFQQLEAIQNQPKIDISPQQIERSQILEKDLKHLSETQNILKSLFLFWRLKSVILSNAPYRAELNDFKSVTKESEELAFLEKYADQGLQILQKTTNDAQPLSMGNSTNSWWDRVVALVTSFIKVEKVDAPVAPAPTALQERQNIEDIIRQMEQILIQPLMTSPLTPSPHSGDAL